MAKRQRVSRSAALQYTRAMPCRRSSDRHFRIMAATHKQTIKPAADCCFICEKRLTGQPVAYLDIGFMRLTACKSCVDGGKDYDFDAEHNKAAKK